jgi:hypothetical protein
MYLYATTKPIILRFQNIAEVENGDDKIYDIEMGIYRIEINISKNTILFSRVSVVNATPPGIPCIHPHITNDGMACWGSWGTRVSELLVANDYLSLLLIINEFLSQCDPYGWYFNALAFDKDATKRCNRCWHLPDSCTCNICSKCGLRIVQIIDGEQICNCFRCPNTDDFVDEDKEYCKECSSFDVATLTCEY